MSPQTAPRWSPFWSATLMIGGLTAVSPQRLENRVLAALPTAIRPYSASSKSAVDTQGVGCLDRPWWTNSSRRGGRKSSSGQTKGFRLQQLHFKSMITSCFLWLVWVSTAGFASAYVCHDIDCPAQGDVPQLPSNEWY